MGLTSKLPISGHGTFTWSSGTKYAGNLGQAAKALQLYLNKSDDAANTLI